MSTVSRFNQVIGCLAKEETTYGVAATLADASDGVTPFIGDGDPPPPEKFEYVYDGKIGRAAGTLAPQKRTTPNGRFRQGQFRALPKGLGTAYTSSATIPPREIHRWLKAAGFDATFTTSYWDYTPSAANSQGTSLTYRQYAQGLQYDNIGVIADFSWETQGLGVPVMTFDWRGVVANLPTEAALPSVTYLAPTVIPPVASAVLANLGSFAFGSGGLRKVSYKRNRSIDTPRVNQTVAGGHAGFVPGGSMPTFEVEIESVAFVGTPFHAAGGIAWDALREAATSIAVDFTFGSTAGNTWKHAFAQAQCIDAVPGNEGPLATVVLSFAAHASTPSANDAESLRFS